MTLEQTLRREGLWSTLVNATVCWIEDYSEDRLSLGEYGSAALPLLIDHVDWVAMLSVDRPCLRVAAEKTSLREWVNLTEAGVLEAFADILSRE